MIITGNQFINEFERAWNERHDANELFEHDNSIPFADNTTLYRGDDDAFVAMGNDNETIQFSFDQHGDNKVQMEFDFSTMEVDALILMVEGLLNGDTL